MELESLEINGHEFVNPSPLPGVLLFEGTALDKRTGGDPSELSFSVAWEDGCEAVVGLGYVGSCYVGRGTVPGLAVELTADSELEFAGRIASQKIRRIAPGRYHKELSCHDKTWVLDRTFLGSSVHTSLTDSQIIEQIFAALPSVDISEIETIGTIDTIDLSSLSLRDAMERISERTGAEWYLTPDMVLVYRDPANASNSFGLSESPDDVSTFALLLDGTEVTEEAADQANSVTAKNIPYEETAQSDVSVSASSDDGQVSKQYAAYPPSSGSATVDTSATNMQARNRFIAATPGSITPTTTGTSDGHVGRVGASFPPDAGTNIQSDAATTATAQCSFNGLSYLWYNILLRFDTSAIPDTATITSATLSFFGLTTNSNSASLKIGYYAWSPSMSGSADYSSLPDDSALAATTLASLSTGNNTLNLQGLSNISKTGYTGLRFYVYTAATPTGINSLLINTGEAGSNVPTLTVNYSDGGTDYQTVVALVRFDTSSLPDTAEIRSASLVLNIEAKEDADSAQLGVEYHASSNWPIDSGDWTSTPANSAGGYTNLSSISVGQLSIPLSDVDANINKTGYTGIRLHIKCASTPTGDNRLDISSKDHATASLRPVLQITYAEVPLIEGSASDQASIDVYTEMQDTVIDGRIKSVGEAELRASVEVERRAWPRRTATVSFFKDGCRPAAMLYIESPSTGTYGQLPVRSISARWQSLDLVKYTAQLGFRKPSLERLLRKINRVA